MEKKIEKNVGFLRKSKDIISDDTSEPSLEQIEEFAPLKSVKGVEI